MNTKFQSAVSIIGTGKVATHLAFALYQAGHTIVEVYGRDAEKAKSLSQKINAQAVSQMDQLNTTVSLFIIAVSDDAISTVSTSIPESSALVVHTSGFRGVDEIHNKFERRGVFYPLQTFTENSTPDFNEIPFFVEAINENDCRILDYLAHTLSQKVHHSDLKQRQKLHLAAAFVSNFTNCMFSIGEELIGEEGLKFSIFHSLISETVRNAILLSPANSQTGPARRNDKGTIRKHLELLAHDRELTEIYRLLKYQIQKKYNLLADE